VSFHPGRAPKDARRRARALPGGLRQIWPVGAPARSKCAAQTCGVESGEHERPGEAEDPADHPAKAAVLSRFSAEISSSKRMRPFTYRNGVLHAEDVALATIAEAVATPFY